MKYQANPVIVDAFEILQVEQVKDALGVPSYGYYNLVLCDNNRTGELRKVVATPEMTSRMTPKVDDYWVIQSDGYTYLNPKEVFERKYHRLDGVIEINAKGEVSGPPASTEFLADLRKVR